MASWTPEERQYIADYYRGQTASVTASALGRTRREVKVMAKELGVVRPPKNKKGTLCWGCANATGGCSWSKKRPQPVPGWTAERTTLQRYKKNAPLTESYLVLKCPQFQPDERRRGSE